VRPLVESLPERADGHYTVNHMKRFVRCADLPAGERYFGFLTKLNPALRATFFNDSRRFAGYFDNCRELVLQHFNSANVDGAADSLDRALYCDLKTYLPEDILAVTDRLSMHHGLEVRVPFLDHKFLEFCATIPPELKLKGMRKKHLLKSAVRQYLPREVITHRKQGFVGPMTRWLKKRAEALRGGDSRGEKSSQARSAESRHGAPGAGRALFRQGDPRHPDLVHGDLPELVQSVHG
jgi:asparagine synthase (glutamine-hydrolysing)